ncbi:hypothetical protein Bpfe_030695, partial [Biomphalaria pfeifferi]
MTPEKIKNNNSPKTKQFENESDIEWGRLPVMPAAPLAKRIIFLDVQSSRNWNHRQ